MGAKTGPSSAETHIESAEKTAEIIRSEVMFGNIRIRCPGDGTEHEVRVSAETFDCPIDGEKLIIRRM